jgi:hypothetical protein
MSLYHAGDRARRSYEARRRADRNIRPTALLLESRELMAAGPLGVNLTGFDFVNAMMDAQGWQPAPGQTTLTRDANGWPTSDATVLVMDDRVNQSWNGPDPNAAFPNIGGTYALSFQGQATLTPQSWLQNWTVQNQVYNAATNTTTASIVVQQNTDPMLYINFTSTVNPASATGAGVTNVKLIQPGYAANTTQMFSTALLNALQPFTAIRYLNVDAANYYAPTYNASGQLQPLQWSQRTLPSQASQVESYNGSQGVAWEYMVALANATNTDMWINVPGPASDDYVRQLANLIQNGDTVNGVTYAGLKPSLHVYLEYSNEVWGGIYTPYAYNNAAAQQAVANGDTALENDGNTNTTAWANRYYLQRTMQITNIFRSLVGADPTYARIRPVADWQEQNTLYFTTTFPWFESTYGAPSQYFYGMGNADYWQPTDFSSENAIITSLQTAEAQTYLTTQQFTAVANYYGLANVSYEVAPSVNGSASAPSGQYPLAAVRDPRMEAIVAQHFDDWYAAGGSLANYFDGPFGVLSPNNTWDLIEVGLKNNPTSSSRWNGLADVAAASPVAVTAGTAVSPTGPTTLNVATDSLGQNFLTPLTGQLNDWLLNVATAGTYNLTVQTSINPDLPGRYGPAEVQILTGDNQVVGTYPVAQDGLYNLGNLTLKAGLNTLAIRTIHGKLDPSNSYGEYYLFEPSAMTLTPVTGSTGSTLKIANAGFETPSVAAGSVADPTGAGWSSAGIAGNGSTFTSANPASPEGLQAAYLEQTGSFSQEIANPNGGTYQFTFQAAQSGGNGTTLQNFEVLVEGQLVGSFAPTGTGYQYYATDPITMPAGTFTLTIQGLDSAGGNPTALIDQVAIAPQVIPDGGFESPSIGSAQVADPTGGPWSFVGSAGLTGDNGTFTSGSYQSPEGVQSAYISDNGSFSQTVTGWAAGTYQLTFKATQVVRFWVSQETFQVLVDGTVVGIYTPSSTGYGSYTTANFSVGVGTHTIAFVGTGTAGQGNTAMLDNVAVLTGGSANEPPSGTPIGQPIIIANNQAGYSQTSGWTYWSGQQAYGNSVDEAYPGTGTAVATWNFNNLTPGRYVVAADWSPYGNRASNAPYSVYDGTNLLQTLLVNQLVSPVGFTDSAGAGWQTLGTYAIASNSLVVTLSNSANGRVEANAIRIERLPNSALSASTINDQATGYSETSGWTQWFGQGYLGNIDEAYSGNGSSQATWTFGNLTAGNYVVETTWTAYSNRASNAPYAIYDGSNLIDSVAVNQLLAPVGYTDPDRTPWQSLGTVKVVSGKLIVTLNNNANGRVEADAVRIEPLP